MCANLAVKTALCLLLSLIIYSGCASVATHKSFYEPITADLRSGDYSGAARRIEEAQAEKKYASKDRFIYYVDAGLAYHYASSYDTSNIKLTLAENAAEELFTKSISRAAASLLLNDNVLEYAGEDYEVLYTNIFKALNYLLLGSFEDAFVEIRRANLKLDLLEQKYADAVAELRQQAEENPETAGLSYEIASIRFNNSALARYLSMHMYAAEGSWDDAEIDYVKLQEAFETQPHVYPFEMPPVQYYSDSNAVLSIVILSGLSPVKEALNLRLRTDKQLDLVQILYDGPEAENPVYGHFALPVNADYYFKFAIPMIQLRPSEVDHVQISVDGEPLGEVSLLEDVGAVAQETFAAKRSLIYLRSVARAIVKGLAAHEAKEKLDNNKLSGWLAKVAVDVGTDVIENADLRCSRLLPGRILATDFEVSPGTHDIIIEFWGPQGVLLSRKEITNYSVRRGDFNLVQALYLN